MREDHQREDHPASCVMKCRFKECLYDTDIDTEDKTAIDTKLHLLDLHVQAEHAPVPAQPAPAPSAQPATHRRKPEKLPRPTVRVDETREGWDNFELNSV